MRRTALIALGLGAAAYSMRDRKRRKQVARFLEPMTNMEMADMMPSNRTIKKMRKSIMKTFS